jgi:DNA polymerase III subunit alpha
MTVCFIRKKTMPNHEELFRFWLAEGYRYRRLTNVEMQRDPQTYKDRMKQEYEIIRKIPGYIDYFLMCSDLVRWAKDRGILVGPGRGSAAGALVCYLLRITELDALQYPMLFERFISPDRPDLPDIDIDFEDERRGEVIQYAQEKYGYDRVANILNFVRYRGRNSLDDIARVYHVPEWKIEAIKDKLVERAHGHARFADTLQDTLDGNPELAEFLEQSPEIQFATRLEGNYRNSSIHPAGIVISGVPLQRICATYEKQSGKDRGSGIAYDKKDAEYLGLLKVDFLSLTTLTGIRATLDALGMSIDQFYQIPLNDPNVYERFRAGDVLGIFQFEGGTTRRVLKQVAPTKFMDLVDVNALSRPGGDDKAYVRNKNKMYQNGKFTGEYAMADQHPILRQHLEWTHGVIVYQEQIMLIISDLGNFPPSDVNAVRKIISDKQDATVLNEYFEKFAEGAATHGLSRQDAVATWQHMINATGYAFNISHAACYSDTAYRQMWLKVYHPEFYLGQVLKCPTDAPGLDRRRRLIVEAQRHGVKVEPPNLEVSQQNWVLVDGTMYAGFSEVKGIGPSIANAIVEWRDNNRQYLTTWGYDSWESLQEVPGIGPGRIKTIRDFVYHDDPFGVLKTQRTLDSIRDCFAAGEFPGVPEPTHNSQQLTEIDELVVFMGILKGKRYKDYVEQKLKYGPEGLTRESILEDLDSPHLLKYVALECEDEYDEPVRVRISRKAFPRYQDLVRKGKVDRDIVVAKGYVSDYGGLSIQVKDMVMIDPES